MKLLAERQKLIKIADCSEYGWGVVAEYTADELAEDSNDKKRLENNVHLICFPPHCTHIIQPLDMSVFSPVKDAWRKILKEYQLETCDATVTKEDFPRLVSRLWEVTFLPTHMKSGFLKRGLCPLNREAIPSHKLSKALPHNKPSTGEGNESSSSQVTESTDCSSNNKVVLHLPGNLPSIHPFASICVVTFPINFRKINWEGNARRINRNSSPSFMVRHSPLMSF